MELYLKKKKEKDSYFVCVRVNSIKLLIYMYNVILLLFNIFKNVEIHLKRIHFKSPEYSDCFS